VATKNTKKVVEEPKESVDPQAALTAAAQEVFLGKSEMIGIRATFTALTIVDNKVVEVDMGSIQSIPRMNKSGSRGFYLNGKQADPTLVGQANSVRYQIGAHITAVGSKDW